VDAQHDRGASLIPFDELTLLTSILPPAFPVYVHPRERPMNQSREQADVEKHPDLRDTLSHVPLQSLPRDALVVPRPLESHEGAALVRAHSRAPGISPWLFVIATALNTTVASTLAVIITLGLNQDRSGDPRDAARTQPFGAARGPSADGAFQQISLQPVGSPDQPLQLEPQRPARLPLQILPQEAANEPFILALSGAPPGTILFGADRISSDSWFLSPGAANRLEIVLPEWSTSVFEIAVALRRTNGQAAAQARAWIVVPPPGGMPSASLKMDEAAARELLTKADRLITKGDIVGARAIYQRAAEMGSGAAALALGTTYDPNRLWSLGALGLAGNKERARRWYLRAIELGTPEAKARLAALGY
jgi:hypothetical protein